MKSAQWFREAADALDNAPRQGGERDDPDEGTRYIILSDTVAKMISDVLRAAAEDL